MVPYTYNMVDMEGIDLADIKDKTFPGLFNKIVESLNACGVVILYNWYCAWLPIPPQHVDVVVVEDVSITINGMIIVNSDDTIEIPTMGGSPVLQHLLAEENRTYEPPEGVDGFDLVEVDVPSYAPVIESITLTENGVYNAPSGVDGYTPINVNVSGGGSDPSLPSEYQEVEYITFDGNEFMLVENLPSNYLIDVVASNSVSMSESCVVGYREANNNNSDFEVRFQGGTFNVWARSSDYTYIAFKSNPTGSTLNVVRDIVVACIDHARGKFLIGKYSTENMDIAFKGSLYAIKLYEVTRTAGSLTAIEACCKFIPCYRRADDEIGVYEVYTSTFYPNEGIGTLGKGPDVN